MAVTTKQKWTVALVVTIIALILFIWYYFKKSNENKEKCPDGSNIPASGDCSENYKKGSTGNIVTPPIIPQADANGCFRPSSYTNNSFPLTLGMKGDLVKQLQTYLNKKYNSVLSTDGYFGCKTRAALQKALSIDAVDMITFNSITGAATTINSGQNYNV